MRQSQLILSNALLMWTSQLLSLFPQVVFVPYLIGKIGESGYGLYALTWSLLLSINQLERSLQSGIVKFSAAYMAQGRLPDVNRVLSSGFVYSLSLAILACTGTLFWAESYRDSSGQTGIALAVVAILLLFIIPLTPFVAILQAQQRFFVGAIADTVSRYLSLAAVIVWFHLSAPSVDAVIVITAGMLFLSRLAQVPVAYRLVPGLRNSLGLCSREHLKAIVAFGSMIVLVSACFAVNTTGIRWLMDSLVSTRFVAHMTIMLMPGVLLLQFLGSVTTIVMPAASSYQATGNQKKLQELLIRGMRYTMIVALAGVISAFLLIRDVFAAWVGKNYLFLAPYSLWVFSSVSFMVMTSTAHHILKGLGWLRVTVLIYFAGFVAVPACLLLLVLHYSHDPYLALTAGLVAGNMVIGLLQIAFGAKAAGASLAEMLVRVLLQPLMMAGVAGVIAFITASSLWFDGLAARIFLSLLIILLYSGGCIVFISTKAERQEIWRCYQFAKNRLLYSNL